MKILLLIDSFSTGGAELSTLTLFGYLKEKGVSVRIARLVSKQPEYHSEAFGFSESEIYTFTHTGFLQKRKEFIRLLADFQPDIVHSVLFRSNLLVRSVRMTHTDFVHLESLVNLTYSDNRLNEPKVSWLKLKFYQYLDMITAFLGTDYFHANGFSVAEHYQSKLKINPKKITVIYRGRNAEAFAVPPAERACFQIPEDRLVLVNVARQEFQKGQDVLLHSLSLLNKEVLAQVHVLVVGKSGNFSPTLQETLTTLHLQDHVTFLGHRNDVPALLNMADIFVFPSRYEGLPGSLIEAEGAGLPIICTHLPMMLEVIEVNKNALTFPSDNAAALAAAITEMVCNPALRHEFGERSRAIFLEKFQIEAVHQKMHALYVKRIAR